MTNLDTHFRSTGAVERGAATYRLDLIRVGSPGESSSRRPLRPVTSPVTSAAENSQAINFAGKTFISCPAARDWWVEFRYFLRSLR